MSAAELVSVCGLCGCLYPVNGPCPVPPPGGGTEAAPVPVVDAGSGHLAGLPAVEAVRPWVERCHAAEAEVARLKGLIERDRTGLAAGLDAVRKRLASSFWLGNEGEWGSYEWPERTERAWRGEVRQLLEETDSLALAALRASGDRVTEAFHGPAGPAERESLRASLDAANAEVERLRGDVMGLVERLAAAIRERDEARAAHLTRHATPAGPSRVADGLPVRCQGCGATVEMLSDGLCMDCRCNATGEG